MSELNIYQRINEVMKKVDYVKKDTTVSGGGSYKAVTHDNVTGLIRPHLVEFGVVIRVEQLSGSLLQLRAPKEDIKMHLYMGKYAVDFVNIDNPTDFLRVIFQAHAADTGDKAPGKAASYAVKYALLKTFSIETGENEEGRYYEAPLFSDMQKAQFDELLENEDDLGMACFVQEIGEEGMKGLCGTFEKGRVSHGKAKVKALTQAGWDDMHETVRLIQEHIASNDIAVLELTDELHGTEKRLVAGMLKDGEIAHLKKLKELI